MTRFIQAQHARILNMAVTSWFVTAVIGQWIFGVYVLLFYGTATLKGHPSDWNKVLPNGYVTGDIMGNVVVGSHLLLAITIIFGGPLQLIPKVRNRMPVFHKWNGRCYILSAFVTSLSGFYMVWVRGSVGGIVQHVSISINAILIIVFAVLAMKYARARNIKKHRIWAIRLFLVMNGVWFFRVGLNFWLFMNQGIVGFNPKTFEGPFLNILSFSQYLLPLLLFELYTIAKKSPNKRFVQVVAVIVMVFIIVMAIGIFSASKSVWLPRITEVLFTNSITWTNM
ncbi:putative membrane protein DUF2306 [Lacibacter cauensis]|uniref:Putative membrane protein DUF2306 n=1 Tax=Lacibacter cauensis TaxID=510947 RepID=A0A562SWX1_9BACT|nr:DUF2306 domain-containing protein [Lacibacter cauensis]TWI85742.1 putative membrane protein DUF2306 [Lacibacter cauensis]